MILTALIVLLGGPALFAVVLGARWLDAIAWRGSLTAYRLRLPWGWPWTTWPGGWRPWRQPPMHPAAHWCIRLPWGWRSVGAAKA